jgi:hypothetical protein
MQKTLTVRGKRFTGQQVARRMTSDKLVANGCDHRIDLNGNIFFATYREVQDDFYAPVCDPSRATAIALCPDNGLYKYSIWLTL